MDNRITVKENKTKRWFGKYRGIAFEINNFKTASLGTKETDSWTYYLNINLSRVDEETAKALWLDGEIRDRNWVSYPYHSVDKIDNMNFHGGCTYYSKVSGFDGADKVVKIGCDFQHLWDEGVPYSYENVLDETKKSIDSFLLTSKIKHWCNGNGELYDLSEGKLIKGVFYSEEYWGDKEVYINA